MKAHRGCPLNEEADIRAEMGRMKKEQEKTWSTPTNRTIYQWSEASKTKNGTSARRTYREKEKEISLKKDRNYFWKTKTSGETSHGELVRLTSPEWKFLCISGEKCLQTLWNDIPSEIEGIQYLTLSQDTIWNAARDREMQRPLTQVESRRIQEGQSREAVAKERF